MKVLVGLGVVAAVAAIAGAVVLVATAGESPLSSQITRGFARKEAEKNCLETIKASTLSAPRAAREEICASAGVLPDQCDLSDAVLRDWLDRQLERCVQQQLEAEPTPTGAP